MTVLGTTGAAALPYSYGYPYSYGSGLTGQPQVNVTNQEGVGTPTATTTVSPDGTVTGPQGLTQTVTNHNSGSGLGNQSALLGALGSLGLGSSYGMGYTNPYSGYSSPFGAYGGWDQLTGTGTVPWNGTASWGASFTPYGMTGLPGYSYNPNEYSGFSGFLRSIFG